MSKICNSSNPQEIIDIWNALHGGNLKVDDQLMETI